MRTRMTGAALALGTLVGTSPLEARPQRAPAHVVAAVRRPHLTIRVEGAIHVRGGHGRLDVAVSPERAKVYVDGRYRGRGDQRLVLPAGSHRVRVVLGDGREVEASTVHVEAGHTTRVRLDI